MVIVSFMRQAEICRLNSRSMMQIGACANPCRLRAKTLVPGTHSRLAEHGGAVAAASLASPAVNAGAAWDCGR